MIEKLKADEESDLFDYIAADPEVTLFIRGDIESEGLTNSHIVVYANKTANGYDCVLLDYFGEWNVYSRNPQYNAQVAADFLQKQHPQKRISGKKEIIEKLHPYFNNWQMQNTKMSRIYRLADPHLNLAKATVAPVTTDQADQVVDLYEDIVEFSASNTGLREQRILARKRKINNGEICMGVFEGKRLVAVAGCTAMFTQGAMIVGVATAPDRRHCGYATAALCQLIKTLQRQNRNILCLFFDNPNAGAIYHHLGFKDVADYTMMHQ